MRASLATAAEFPTETAALVAATQRFFDAVEAQQTPDRRPPVVSAPLLATPASVTFDDAKSHALTLRGPVDHLTGYRINWYPVDRLLGSVDFMGTWDKNRSLVCGYVTWDLSDPDLPTIETVSANFVDFGDLAGASADDIHAALLDANCAFGDIDDNYAFFE